MMGYEFETAICSSLAPSISRFSWKSLASKSIQSSDRIWNKTLAKT